MPNTQYEVVGVGAGPANLALAAALRELPGSKPCPHVFFERQCRYEWHPAMQLDGATIHLSVLKDLATTRNPQSHFTFLNYLKHQGRLYEFLNLRELFPSRREYTDYLAWVAKELGPSIACGHEVVEVRPCDGRNDRLEVVVRETESGRERRVIAPHVVVGTGGRPAWPKSVPLPSSRRVFHSSSYLTSTANEFGELGRPHRFIVVGQGQSAGELFHDLYRRYPNAEVIGTFRGYAYRPLDDTDFVNEVFFPEKLDYIFDLPDDKRALLASSVRDVNYGVVDGPLIRRIYRLLYEDKVRGVSRGSLRGFHELTRVEELDGGRLRAHFRDLMHDVDLAIDADGIVLCTGYDRSRRLEMLEPIAHLFEQDEHGEYRVGRDHSLVTRPGVDARVYLPGFAEDSHGVSEPVLSLIAHRAERIAESISRGDQRAEPITRTRRVLAETELDEVHDDVPRAAGGRF